MKILLSAFACDPELGSEPGIGWAWAEQLARLGHEVCVITRSRHQAPIERRLASAAIPNLRFTYLDVQRVPYTIPGFSIYPYYYAWQWKAYDLMKKSCRSEGFDCAHHITYGSYRTPFFLSFLPIPSIFGPVGGGEMTPLPLIRGFSPVGRVRELARHIVNFLSTLNPITRLVWRRSSLVLAATESTAKIMPRRYRSKTRVLPAITTPFASEGDSAGPVRKPGQCRALFAGRLLEWKGLHLAIRALALAQKDFPGLRLGILGSGSAEAILRTLARRQGVDSYVEWIPRIADRQKVMEVYDRHDLFLFPSLHDSGGMVVLEALSRGLPVICLDLGGPGALVDATCGERIATAGRSEEEVVRAIALELVKSANRTDAERSIIQKAARRRAAEFETDRVVRRAYAWFSELVPSVKLSHQADDELGK